MSPPEKSRFPERVRPANKATMDQPQEEFIEDEPPAKRSKEAPKSIRKTERGAERRQGGPKL